MASRSGASHGAGRVEIATPLRLNVATAVLKLQGGQDKAPYGSIVNATRRFGPSRSTIWRMARKLRDQTETGEGIDLSRQRKGHCGRKRKPSEELSQAIEKIPQYQQSSIRRVAELTHSNKSTIHEFFRRKKATKRAFWIKPSLTTEQKLQRLRFVVDRVQPVGRQFSFDPCTHWVHIDEKWFYAQSDGRRGWLLQNEPKQGAPTAKSKSFLPKIMFLVAVGRPHKRSDGTVCDGLLGIWPFVTTRSAQRSSKNRLRGEQIIEPINVDVAVFLEQMKTNVFPAIRAAYHHAKRSVVIQLDGAKPHVARGIQEELQAECLKDGFRITIQRQPPQSPDLNILDLGLFHSLQRRAVELKEGGSLIDIVDAVNSAFASYDPDTLEQVWRALFSVQESVLEHEGGNDFAVPHEGARKIGRTDMMEVARHVNRRFLSKARSILEACEMT